MIKFVVPYLVWAVICQMENENRKRWMDISRDWKVEGYLLPTNIYAWNESAAILPLVFNGWSRGRNTNGNLSPISKRLLGFSQVNFLWMSKQ